MKNRYFALVAILLAGAAGRATAAVPANICTDPFFVDTLRCRQSAIPYTHTGPPLATGIKDFTRVNLTDDLTVRCLDGTSPILYVDKARCTSLGGCADAPYGWPTESNKWIFTMRGGGSCHPVDTDGDGVPDEAQGCYDSYVGGEADEMGNGDAPQMENMFGIHGNDLAQNPIFAGYNRVNVKKCSFDRFNGRASWESPGGALRAVDGGGTTVFFNFYQQGYDIMEVALKALRNGRSYDTWNATMRGEVITYTETLPPLKNAQVVLFVGHSGGAHGLMHNIDYLAAKLKSWTGFSGDVRALFDANFIVSIQNEAAFTSTQPCLAPLRTTVPQPRGDAYSDLWSGCTNGSGIPFSYDGQAYYTSSDEQVEYDTWQARFDASCLAAHVGTEWKCRDRLHVLFNHIATPFFIREDFTDPNPAHLPPAGHPIAWGPRGVYPHCGALGVSPCAPVFSATQYHPRLETMALTLWDNFTSRSELALGIDPSLGGGTPAVYLWMPSCGVHEGSYDDAQFFTTFMIYNTATSSIASSMRGWLEAFMSAPASSKGIRMDGWNRLGTTMTSVCPP